MRIRDWSKLAATATTAFHVQYALLPAPTTTSTGNRIRPTQESSSTSSGSGSAHTASPPRLAVVVPTWRGDVDRALEAAARWPTACSAVTLSQVDLVLYKAEGDQGSSASSLSSLEKTGGRCFSKTKFVHANLADEDNFYPKGPSVQFYKIFLDEDVSAHFSEYDAISIIEWDVTVAHNTSFKRLYHAAFSDTEPFWVKGSVLTGGSFHQAASDINMWHVLGHINGNAIYNNNDVAWFEYVEYTRTRWDFEYAYDVALWATIADFPYSWPLWQRYSSKFVTTNLIANVALEKVDKNTISTAIAGDTLFIHGRSIEGGIRRQKTKTKKKNRIMNCGGPFSTAGVELPAHVSTVCDASCGIGGRFMGILCGAGDSQKYGSFCRLCYTDQKAALQAEAGFRRSEEAILFNSFVGEGRGQRELLELKSANSVIALFREPSQSFDFFTLLLVALLWSVPNYWRTTSVRPGKWGTSIVCDTTCGSGRYGDYNCNWRGHGSTCRYCFEDIKTAMLADEVAKRRGGRVIMCDTHEPPRETLVALVADANASVFVADESRKLALDEGDKSKLRQDKNPLRFRYTMRTMQNKNVAFPTILGYNPFTTGNPFWGQNYLDLGKMPREKQEMCSTAKNSVAYPRRLPNRICRPGCKSSEGVTRVCDSSCSGDNPLLHTRGCNDDTFGVNCRTCYTSMAAAKHAESFGTEAIMCDTLEYASADGSFSHTGSNRQQNRRWLSVASLVHHRVLSGYGCSQNIVAFGITLERAGYRWHSSWKDVSDCHPDCESAATSTTRNVCDPECSVPPNSSSLYGTQGCGDSGLGFHCRTCYDDLPAARRAVSSSDFGVAEAMEELLNGYARGQPASMEEQLLPQGSTGGALPEDAEEPSPTFTGRGWPERMEHSLSQAFTGGARPAFPGGKSSSFYGEARPVLPGDRGSSFDAEEFDRFAAMPFEKDVVRGNLCAFISSSAQGIGETDAMVRSVLTFMPGMRTAIAVSNQDISIFERMFSYLPGVTVKRSSNPEFSALLADKYCGDGAKLIYYMNPGSLLSRTFTAKDTHSPQGELLVGYIDRHLADYASRASARASSILLGFESPVFTFGADLMLPSFVNSELCELLLADELLDTATSQAWIDDERVLNLLAEVEDVSAPEVLAAWAYSHNPEGLWFVNPQFWVSHHLFQTVSIWNIPLIKPPFSCAVDPSLSLAEYYLFVESMRHLNALVDGATCESGFIALERQGLERKTP
eukprot:jgi/Undpi1/12548/HiC_scaffold_6.g02217.m1